MWDATKPGWSLKSQINNAAQALSMVSIYDQRLASTSGSSIRLWNLTTKLLIKTLNGHLSGVQQLAISPNQSLLASASSDNTSKVWNLASGLCISTMSGHNNTVRSVLFYTNETLVTGSKSSRIKKTYKIF